MTVPTAPPSRPLPSPTREHPLWFEADPAVIGRIELIRANASRASHAELDAAEELDDGDPVELGSLYAGLLRSHPHLRVLGGCCGTDARHVEAIARACVTAT